MNAIQSGDRAVFTFIPKEVEVIPTLPIAPWLPPQRRVSLVDVFRRRTHRSSTCGRSYLSTSREVDMSWQYPGINTSV